MAKGPVEKFKEETKREIAVMGRSRKLKKLALRFMAAADSTKYKYTYHFEWLGRPIIQFPQDIIAFQEIIWKVKPDLIVETGIAHGGSVIFSASMLELIGGNGKVVGIDIDIRKHNRKLIEKHPLFKRIKMIEGSSTDASVVNEVKKIARGRKRILIFLDSSHAHEHVLRELELYSPLVSRGSYIVACDTIAEYVPEGIMPGRPWAKGSNPKTAVDEFLRRNKKFIIDREIENKLLITSCPGGFLKKAKR